MEKEKKKETESVYVMRGIAFGIRAWHEAFSWAHVGTEWAWPVKKR